MQDKPIQPAVQRLDNLLSVIKSIEAEPEEKIKVLNALAEYIRGDISTINTMLETQQELNERKEN